VTACESTPPAVRVVIVDDHDLFRDALSMLLQAQGHDVVATVSNGEQAVTIVGELEPDVVLMDVKMPIVDGMEAARRIKCQWPAIKVVMLSAFDDEEYVLGAIKLGAEGYVLKDTPGEEFGALVQAVSQGEQALPAHITPPASSGDVDRSGSEGRARGGDGPSALSRREGEVLNHVASGMTNREIAAELSISEHTVRNHMARLLSKLGLRNRAEAAAYAVRMGQTD
jgi:DNA-binding NarL/FixJ family response regulator